eukprot:scaffold3898_cov401-Prasinococcus_capsulatus_cf.AAC.1
MLPPCPPRVRGHLAACIYLSIYPCLEEDYCSVGRGHLGVRAGVLPGAVQAGVHYRAGRDALDDGACSRRAARNPTEAANTNHVRA